jgi:hypothetical protein
MHKKVNIHIHNDITNLVEKKYLRKIIMEFVNKNNNKNDDNLIINNFYKLKKNNENIKLLNYTKYIMVL